jgi:hypothetical protein
VTRRTGILYESECTFITISLSVLLRTRRNIQTKALEGITAHISFSVTLFEILPFIGWCEKNLLCHLGHGWQYDVRALHAGYIRLQTHTQNMFYLLFLYYNNGCRNPLICYAMHSSIKAFMSLTSNTVCHVIEEPDFNKKSMRKRVKWASMDVLPYVDYTDDQRGER